MAITYLEDLTVGQTASASRQVTDDDIRAFAAVSGDANPIHLDEKFAASTRFGGRIAHGMLTGALVSAVVGMQLPGEGSIYLSQSFRFRAPVRIGNMVEITVTVTRIDAARKHVYLATECRVADRLVLDGEALLLTPSRGPARA